MQCELKESVFIGLKREEIRSLKHPKNSPIFSIVSFTDYSRLCIGTVLLSFL